MLHTAPEEHSEGLESLLDFEMKFLKLSCLILSTEQIEGKFRLFAIIPEGALLISPLVSEL